MNNYVPPYYTDTAGVDGETGILLATSGLLADLQACGAAPSEGTAVTL